MEKIICEKCGHEMMDLSNGPYISIKCPHCGWGWATFDDENNSNELTDSSYSVTFEGGQSTKERIRLLTVFLTGNSLDSRRLLEEGGTIAVDHFREKEQKLIDSGIRFSATLVQNANQ